MTKAVRKRRKKAYAATPEGVVSDGGEPSEEEARARKVPGAERSTQEITKVQCTRCTYEGVHRLLVLHLRRKHEGPYSQEEGDTMGLTRCPCGALVTSGRHGLAYHQQSGTCPLDRQTHAPTDDRLSSGNVETGREASQEQLQEQHRRLAALPGLRNGVSPHTHDAFCKRADDLATAFLNDPSAQHLFDILALPKVGLVPVARRKSDRIVSQHLTAYPDVPWPSLAARRSGPATRTDRVDQAMSMGRLTRAATSLFDDSLTLPRPSPRLRPNTPLAHTIRSLCD